MGTSKILIDGVGIDLTADTVAENTMLSGIKAHDSNGDAVTGTIPSKAAATYTPGTTDQTIAAGQYLSGAQTVKGDANLIAGNIRSGKSIFGVAGSLTPGITPSGTKNITENGTYDVTEFASAAVNVPSSYQEGTLILQSNYDSIVIPVAGKLNHVCMYVDTPVTELTRSAWVGIVAGNGWCRSLRWSSSGSMGYFGDETTVAAKVFCSFEDGAITIHQNLGNAWGYEQPANWIAW